MIEKINKNMGEVEREMRTVVMLSLGNNEQSLLNLLKEDREDWYGKWKEIRRGAKIEHLSLIFYSDTGELVKIFRWCRKNIKNLMASTSKSRIAFDNIYDEIIAILNIGDITKERNETYHIRLLEREEEDLEKLCVFTRTLTQNISKLKELVS